jgi:hypothetical protein
VILTYLVNITSTIWRHIPQRLTQNICIKVLALLLNRPALCASHDDIRNDERASIAPLGVDRIVDFRQSVARIDDVTNVEAELRGLGHSSHDERISDSIAVVGNVLLREQTSTDDGLLVRWLIFEHVDVELEECGECFGVRIIWDFGGVELGVQWLQDSLEFCFIHVGTDEWCDVETPRTGADLEVDKHAVVGIVIGKIVEDSDGLGEELSIVGVGRVDVEDGSCSRDFRERLDSDRSDDSVGAGTAALESPVQIWILLRVGSHVLALGGDGVEGEDVVSAHAIDSRKWAVATTLEVSASPADGLFDIRCVMEFESNRTYRTLATNNDDFRALCKSLTEQLTSLYTSTNDSSTARPLSRSAVLLHELDVLEAVGVDDQRSVSGGTAHEIVASIANDEAQVTLSRKVDTSFDLVLVLRHDHVVSVEAARAWFGGVVRWHTCVVRTERPQVRNGMVSSIPAISLRTFSNLIHDLQPLLIRPVCLSVRALRRIIHTRRIAKILVAYCTRWYRNLKRSTRRLVQLLPILIRWPTSIVAITLALIVDTIDLLHLTDPLRTQDTVGSQKHWRK